MNLFTTINATQSNKLMLLNILDFIANHTAYTSVVDLILYLGWNQIYFLIQ